MQTLPPFQIFIRFSDYSPLTSSLVAHFSVFLWSLLKAPYKSTNHTQAMWWHKLAVCQKRCSLTLFLCTAITQCAFLPFCFLCSTLWVFWEASFRPGNIRSEWSNVSSLDARCLKCAFVKASWYICLFSNPNLCWATTSVTLVWEVYVKVSDVQCQSKVLLLNWHVAVVRTRHVRSATGVALTEISTKKGKWCVTLQLGESVTHFACHEMKEEKEKPLSQSCKLLLNWIRL